MKLKNYKEKNMKCVCRNCYKVVELSEPKYNSMSDSF